MTKLVPYSAIIMPYSYSGDKNKQSKYLINILGATESKKYLKMLRSSDSYALYVKKHLCLGRDLKNLFLPYKKYFSVICDDSSNFL